MEYLDVYDEQGNYIGKEDRKIVHRDALWHKTVHCWLYSKDGSIYFQRRKDEGTLYTTASGHIKAGETVKEGFGREIKEEIGISIDYEKAEPVSVVKFIMDRENKDGSLFRDRAFANVYVYDYEGDIEEFNFDDDEVSALAKVNAKDALKLLTDETGTIEGTIIEKTKMGNISKVETLGFKDFLVNKGETAIEKYGEILKKVIELTENLQK